MANLQLATFKKQCAPCDSNFQCQLTMWSPWEDVPFCPGGPPLIALGPELNALYVLLHTMSKKLRLW